MTRFKLNVYTHGFTISVNFQQDKKIMSSFTENLNVYESRFDWRAKRSIRKFKLSYSIYIPRTMTYGLHKNLMPSFLDHLKKSHVSESEIETIHHRSCKGEDNKLILAEGVEPRDYQPPIIDFINKADDTRVLPLQTGKGKTFCALYSIYKNKKRAAITLGASHVETWLKDANWIFTNAGKEVVVIRGKKELKNAISLGRSGDLDASILIFTTGTIRDYLTDHEKTGKSTYGCLPKDLYKVLGIGFRVVDEAHENLHFNFRHSIETNISKVLYLSATIQSNDSFTNRMYEIIFPRHLRYEGLDWHKYIAVKAIGYNLIDPESIKYNGSMGYSHNLFEQSIMAKKVLLENYMNMITNLVVKLFVTNYLPKQKLLIYVSSIDFSERLAKYIKRDYNCKDFRITAYNGKHEDEVLHSHDIVVSTPNKAGTGKDIKGLVVVISTVAINAMEKNIQMLGRLRDISDLYPNLDPLFCYLVCMSIQKHVDYHLDKVAIFTPKVKIINCIKTSYKI